MTRDIGVHFPPGECDDARDSRVCEALNHTLAADGSGRASDEDLHFRVCFECVDCWKDSKRKSEPGFMNNTILNIKYG